MVPTVTDVAQTVMYLEVVIGQVDSVKEAVNVDGEETLVIKVGLFYTTYICILYYIKAGGI